MGGKRKIKIKELKVFVIHPTVAEQLTWVKSKKD